MMNIEQRAQGCDATYVQFILIAGYEKNKKYDRRSYEVSYGKIYATAIF